MESIRGNIMNYSQDKNIFNTTQERYYFGYFIPNNKQINSYANFNIGNYNKIHNIKINNSIINNNRFNLNDCITTRLFLRNKLKEKPLKIKKELSNNDNFLILLLNDKKNNSIISSKEHILRTENDFEDKKMKNFKFETNKSFYSLDKFKLNKKNFIKKYLIKHINNLNIKINKGNIYNKCATIESSKIVDRKRGHSSNFENLNKSNKLILKKKELRSINKTSLDIIDIRNKSQNSLLIKEDKDSFNYLNNI